jgi:uncharacterized membrane protein
MQGNQTVIQIIPNWHPIFVHFTLALFTTSVGFYGLAYITSRLNAASKSLVNEFEIVARWCLWVGALLTIITVLAGWYAFDTVTHDEISHVAMHTHRNWALPTAGMILLVAGWSWWRYAKQKKEPTLFFLILLLAIQLSLLSTAWHGSELVYRYGLGVMSLPAPKEPDHHHSHE